MAGWTKAKSMVDELRTFSWGVSFVDRCRDAVNWVKARVGKCGGSYIGLNCSQAASAS